MLQRHIGLPKIQRFPLVTDFLAMNAPVRLPKGLQILGKAHPGFDQILSPEALDLVVALHRQFESRRQELLAARAARQKAFDAGKLPDFLPETQSVRESDWTVAPQPRDMRDRRVEITGPTDRKMVINALNSGASTFMADFEDANCPTWFNMIDGQINLRDAVRRTITLRAGRQALQAERQDRGADSRARAAGTWTRSTCWSTASRFRAASSISRCTSSTTPRRCSSAARGPYFYLPKMESHLEARLWNDIFKMAQDALGVPQGIDQGDRA